MSNKLYEETSVQSIANAIRSVNGKTQTYKIAQMANAIQQLGPIPNDVEFYDYDGTLLYSYSSSEFASLTALPPNPTHEGLTSRGWNWALADAKTYVASYGKLIIGQTYITNDGKTRLYIKVGNNFNMTLGFKQSVANGVVVDWGDNSSTSSEAATGHVGFSHTYATAGEYVISLTVSSNGLLTFDSPIDDNTGLQVTDPSGPKSAIRKVEIGARAAIASTSSYIFSNCYSLSTITLPIGVTQSGQYTFQNCKSLDFIVFPTGFTTFNTNAFYSSTSLSLISIPKSATAYGTYAFTGCIKLKTCIIPEGVQTVSGRLFQRCYNLETVILPNSITKIDTYAFDDCLKLKSINVQNVVTYVQYCFRNCFNLENITIKSGTTSIASSSFSSCCALKSISLPSTVTGINATAFSGCISLMEIFVNSTTPPALTASATSFDTLPTNYVIYVPSGTRATYVANAYWGLFASHIVEQL